MATKKTFNFSLGQSVATKLSGESGIIIGRAQYLRANPSYYFEYVAADGRQTQAWFDEEALLPSGEPVSEDRAVTKDDLPDPETAP